MRDGERGAGGAGDGERTRVEGSPVSAPRGRGRGWSAEDKARVVGESFRCGQHVGEVAQRYGISRWQLSAWRRMARQGELAVESSTEPVVGRCEVAPAFAALEVEASWVAERGSGSVVVEARGVTVRLEGAIGASRIAEVAYSGGNRSPIPVQTDH